MKLADYLRINRIKLIKSCFCFVSFFGLGGCCTLMGSSLLDLQIRMSLTFSQVSGLVPSRSIGYLIGGVLSGFIDSCFGPDMILFLTNFSAGILVALAPWFKQFNAVYACLLLSGVSQGVFDIYTNTYTLAIWGNQATNYVQILHGSFGLGSLLTPLLVKPFLLPLVQNSTNSSESGDNVLGTYTPDDVKVQYPFVVVGLILIFTSFGFLMFYFKDDSNRKNDQSSQTTDSNDHPNWKIAAAISAVAIIAHTTFGVETMIGSVAPAFAVKSDLQMTKQDGANLVTLFWSVFTFYRLIFIALTNVIKEKYLMYFNYSLILISVVLMVPHAAYNQLIAWISLAMLGVGFSPTFSVSLGLLQKYINVSNKYASFIFIFASVGEAVHPWIVAKFMDRMPVVFIYYTGFLSVIQTLSCLLLPFICRQLFKSKPKLTLDRSASIRSSQR
ncbi:sodium-dependent glucose transporter 1-like [Panonychus citri]|uniref:sodium-dependent glucose transporter 1-like n=1 Tax=Panonychus citri TaxID=50023 RepID=UPI002307CE56|nr:sodium-dependent glucose transporter 1-like [Panonychus citri]